MEMGYYANAVELTKAISNILPKYRIKHDEEIDLPWRVERLKSLLVKLNNGYLEKMKSVIGNKRYMLPYMIDEKLRKKKYQPEYVKNGKVHTYHLDGEWRFIQGCKNGRWHLKSFRDNLNLRCRFLHHQTPYLKLGPFKEDHISNRPYIVVFRDILSDENMKHLINKSEPHLSQ